MLSYIIASVCVLGVLAIGWCLGISRGRQDRTANARITKYEIVHYHDASEMYQQAYRNEAERNVEIQYELGLYDEHNDMDLDELVEIWKQLRAATNECYVIVHSDDIPSWDKLEQIKEVLTRD